MGARSPSRRRRRQVDKCRDKSAQTIRHELRYARPAVLPSTGAPRASWNPLTPPLFLSLALSLALALPTAPAYPRHTDAPDHPILHHYHHHHPSPRVPLLDGPTLSPSCPSVSSRSPGPTRSSPLPQLALFSPLFVSSSSVPFRSVATTPISPDPRQRAAAFENRERHATDDNIANVAPLMHTLISTLAPFLLLLVVVAFSFHAPSRSLLPRLSSETEGRISQLRWSFDQYRT